MKIFRDDEEGFQHLSVGPDECAESVWPEIGEGHSSPVFVTRLLVAVLPLVIIAGFSEGR